VEFSRVAAADAELAVDRVRGKALEMLRVLEHEGAHPFCPLIGIGLGEDGDGVGDAARGDPDLAAGDDVLVAVALGARLHSRRVTAGAGLAERVRGELGATRQVGQQPSLLLLGPGDHQWIAAERLHREDQGAGRADLGNLFDRDVQRERAARQAPVLGREGQSEEIVLAEEIDHVPREFAAAVDVRGAGCDAVAGDVANRVADHGLLFVESDVHAADATKPSQVNPWASRRRQSRSR
jgi:hypothetical protein